MSTLLRAFVNCVWGGKEHPERASGLQNWRIAEANENTKTGPESMAKIGAIFQKTHGRVAHPSLSRSDA